MKQGFTLIELMIVVAIIAIIAAIAIPNMVRSRMAANEATAVAACKAFAEAEDIYRRTDWNGDGILEYALSVTGNYSLYERTGGSADLQLVDTTFASATCGNVQPDACTAPKGGYSYWVLTGQGAGAPGGTKSYIVQGRLALGYALSAVPFSYDATGRNSFQISNSGTVYQSDRLTTNTAHIVTYDLSAGGCRWTPTE